MPVVDDELTLPQFTHFSNPRVVKKPVATAKTPLKASPAAAKASSAAAKASSAAAKASSAAAKASPAAAKASSAAAKASSAAAKASSAAAKASSAAAKTPLKGLFAAKASSAAAKASPAAAKATSASLFPGLFAAPSAGLFADTSAGLFADKAPSAADAAKVHSSPPSVALSFGLGMKPKFKKPVSFTSPVDIFTTAKCGHPFCSSLLCDPPYVDLVRFLSEHPPSHHAKGAKGAKYTKDEVRQLVEDAMVQIRAEPRHADALTRAENIISCHKQGSNMTELFLFGPSLELPIVESVSMVDLETGDVRDVHEMFGLVKKTVVMTLPDVVPDAENMREGLQAKAAAELELIELLKMPGVNPFYVDMKKAHIQTIDATIAGELKESKFEYSPELKEKYGERVKLSDLLKIGISNGLDPDNDVLALYACRIPDGPVTNPLYSPRNGRVGGGSKTRKHNAKKSRCKTCKHKRMKR